MACGSLVRVDIIEEVIKQVLCEQHRATQLVDVDEEVAVGGMRPVAPPGSFTGRSSFARLMNADVGRGHRDELVEVVGVRGQHGRQAIALAGEGGRVEAEVDDAGVGLLLVEDELAEVAVVGDDDATLPVGDSQHIGVGQAVGVVNRDDGHVVAEATQVGGEAAVGVLVEQELHCTRGAAPGRRGRRGGGVTSSPSTKAWA